MDDLILYGGEVKARGNDIVEGHLVMFSTESDPDISKERDFFTPETDYDLEFAAKTRVLYRHGFDKKLGLTRLAIGELKMDDVGVWVEGQMQLRDDYEKAVFAMAKAGKLGWSSGTAPHLVEREKVGDANKVLRWPLGLDASLTPDPAEPRTMASVKSLMFESAKSQFLGERVEASMAIAAVERLYSALWDRIAASLYGWEPSRELPGTLRDAFNEFAELAVGVIQTLTGTTKSVNDVVTVLEQMAPAKSLKNPDTERDFEAFLRKAGGFSKEDAREITSLSFKKYLELRRREAGGGEETAGLEWAALQSQTLRLRSRLLSVGV